MATEPKSGPKAAESRPLDMQTRPLGSGIDPNRTEQSNDDTPSEKEFDPYHFGITELPAGMRQQLIDAKLPMVPADQLFDTSPPNKRYAATPPKDAPPTAVSLPAANAPKAVAIPLQSRRNLALGVVAVGVVLLVIVIATASATRPTVSTPAGSSSALTTPQVAEPSSAAISTSIPTQVPSLSAAPAPVVKPSEPARVRDSKAPAATDKVIRAGSHPRNSAPAPAASSVPAAPQKASGLDSVLLPKPD